MIPEHLMDNGLNAPAHAVVSLAREGTTGAVSSRHHAASRSQVLDRYVPSTGKASGRLIAVLTTFGVMTVVAGAVSFSAVRHHRTTPAVAIGSSEVPLPPGAASIVTAPAPAAADKTTIEILATPTSATIYWDDAPVPGNPVVLTLRRDGAHHRVRITAAGYLPMTEMVSLESASQQVRISLVAEPERNPSVPHADQVIASLRPAFRKCYQTYGLANGEAPKGSSIVAIKVAADGSIVSTDLVTNDGLPTPVAKCLVGVARGARFEAPGAPARINIPISFFVQ